MNRKYLMILVCMVLVMTMLGGCTIKEVPAETVEVSAPMTSEEPAGKNDEPAETPVITEEQAEGNDGQQNAAAPVSASFPGEELLAQAQAYHEFIADDSEYQVKIEFSTNAAVTNFRVLSLNIENFSDEGVIEYSETKLYSLETLTPDKPLVVGMAFAGDIPNMGISYVDANGVEWVQAIGLSGFDGSPYLVDAELTQ